MMSTTASPPFTPSPPSGSNTTNCASYSYSKSACMDAGGCGWSCTNGDCECVDAAAALKIIAIVASIIGVLIIIGVGVGIWMCMRTRRTDQAAGLHGNGNCLTGGGFAQNDNWNHHGELGSIQRNQMMQGQMMGSPVLVVPGGQQGMMMQPGMQQPGMMMQQPQTLPGNQPMMGGGGGFASPQGDPWNQPQQHQQPMMMM